MKKYRICVVTGTRAEYGLLRNLLFRFRDNCKVDLKLVVTGSHLSEKFGNTQKEVLTDGFKNIIKLKIEDTDENKESMSVSTADAIEKFSNYFVLNRPDILVILGDRYEIFAAAVAANFLGITIAHISGGDVTEGAIDDSIRHCITKMSYLHFPGCAQSAKRIIQMGESPDRVFNVGEPGVENCLNMKFMSIEELVKSIDFDISDGNYSVVTYHPVTMENNTACEQIYELIYAMEEKNDMKYIITMANADAGGQLINNIWLKEAKKHNNWFITPSLGVIRYISTVKYAKLVIGNSSSGIVEAPVLETPTINIGDRQKGRMMAESIISCQPKKEDIVNAMNYALEKTFQNKLKGLISPFGDGTTSEKIEKIILNFMTNNKVTEQIHQKKFYDIDFNI